MSATDAAIARRSAIYKAVKPIFFPLYERVAAREISIEGFYGRLCEVVVPVAPGSTVGDINIVVKEIVAEKEERERVRAYVRSVLGRVIAECADLADNVNVELALSRRAKRGSREAAELLQIYRSDGFQLAYEQMERDDLDEENGR